MSALLGMSEHRDGETYIVSSAEATSIVQYSL